MTSGEKEPNASSDRRLEFGTGESGEEVRRSWREYFDVVLNFGEDEETHISCLGMVGVGNKRREEIGIFGEEKWLKMIQKIKSSQRCEEQISL